MSEQQQQQLPFKQGERVSFHAYHYEGTGRVVGMIPHTGFRNYGVVIEHDGIKRRDALTIPFCSYSCIVVPLYDGFEHAMGFATEPCVVRITQ